MSKNTYVTNNYTVSQDSDGFVATHQTGILVETAEEGVIAINHPSGLIIKVFDKEGITNIYSDLGELLQVIPRGSNYTVSLDGKVTLA